jgi:hypothetical protein
MPTPRLSIQIALQGGRTRPSGATSSTRGTWLKASVTNLGGNLSGRCSVVVNGAEVDARQVIDESLQVGQSVWVVFTGDEYVVAGVQ